MSALTSPFLWLGVLSVFIGLCIAAVAWSQRDARGARTYAALMAVLSLWSTLYIGQLLQSSVAAKRPWLAARHAITPVIGGLFWLFAARYTDRNELLSARYVVPIVGLGSALGALAVLNPAGLYWSELALYTAQSFPRMRVTFGPAFWLMTAYVFLVVGGGHVYFVLVLMDSFSVYRQQLTAMAVVGTIEFALLVVFLTEHVAFLPVLNPWPHIQLITYNLVFVAAPLGWSYLRQSLFSIQILDRQAVIENMEDAVFVFDTEDVLRRVNEPGERLVGAEPQLEGEPASTVFSDTPVLLDVYRSPANGDRSGIESVQLPVEGRKRWYDVNVSRIRNSANEQTGTVLVARDVTTRRRNRRKLQERTEELKQKTRRLERQNERLDQFAGVVSHDLKNPLNVAQLQFELVREEVPADDAAVIDRNLDRMEAMIDELLTMARAGTTIENREQLSLVSIVEQAWETIQDERATLDNRIDDQLTVDGDPDLLLNVFENLFHNSIEHGAPRTDSAAGITIRVGRLEASEPVGFYVEDSGRGIPEQRGDEIFEFGLTTREDGTGFGLAIVRELIRAHGWEITATSGTDGGARFEIRTDTAPDEQPSSV